MSPRARVLAIVALAAAAAVAGTVGVTLLQTRGATSGVKALKGAPPLWLDFGVRTDAQARALARAVTLYKGGQRARAEAIFSRYPSLEARIGAAFARWPDHSLDDVKRLVASHPRSALAELHLGWALYWSGRDADAIGAWQLAAKLEPDSPAAVDAQTALHPSMVPGLPYILTPDSPPAAVTRLPAAQELQALARAAAKPDARAKLFYGVALWNLRHPVSAERQFRAAAALAPHDPTVLTAVAVGAFSKAAPVRAFSQLGPLTGVFSKEPVVRFHLGLLLLWTKQVRKAERQLRLAIADNPRSVYAKQARALLAGLLQNGTK